MVEGAGINPLLSGLLLPRPSSVPAEAAEDAPDARTGRRAVDPPEVGKAEVLRDPQAPIQPPRPSMPSQARRSEGAAPVVLSEKSPAAGASRSAFSTLLSERIAEAANQPSASSGDRIRIKLRPPHLGDLVIELRLAGGRLRGRIVAETEAARDAIGSHLDDLRRRLERRGIRVGELEVGVETDPTSPVLPGLRSARRQLLDVVA